MRFVQVLVCFVVSLIIVGCIEKSETLVRYSSDLPFSLLSQRELLLDDPIFAYHYGVTRDEDCLFVGEQKDTNTMYPVQDGRFFYLVYAPFISKIQSFNDSVVFFKLNPEIRAEHFGICYRWQSSSLPDSFIWTDSFDDVEYCTDRYFALYLTWDLSAYDQLKMIRRFSRSTINDVDTAWRGLFSTKDTVSWRTIVEIHNNKNEYHSLVSLKNRCVLWREILLGAINYSDIPPVDIYHVQAEMDSTTTFIMLDSLHLFMPYMNNNEKYLFSPETVARQFDYPFYTSGLNSYAINLESSVAVESVSEKVYQGPGGIVYKIPDRFNQKQFRLIMKLDRTRMEYSLSTCLNPIVERMIRSEMLGHDSFENFSSVPVISSPDSVFIYGNLMIKQWLQTKLLMP